MTPKKQKKNELIYSWRKYFIAWSKKYKAKFKISDIDLKDKIKEQAIRQLELIEQSRPNKDQTAKEQANTIQKEYQEWLENVIETGNLYDI